MDQSVTYWVILSLAMSPVYVLFGWLIVCAAITFGAHLALQKTVFADKAEGATSMVLVPRRAVA